MPSTTINVYYSSGSPAVGTSVSLSFTSSGVTQSFRTDSRGCANVSHTATGSAKVIIDGATQPQIINAPGNYSFTK